MNVTKTVAGLRELADYLETHADKFGTTDIYGGVTVFLSGPELVAELPGTFEKKYDSHSVTVVKSFSGLNLTLYLTRSQLCEKVRTGRTVTRRVPTAWEEVEEEEYEWDCKPILQAAAERS